MRVYNFTSEELATIIDGAEENLESYRDHSFSVENFLWNNGYQPRDSEIVLPNVEFVMGGPDDEPSKYDLENAIRLYEALNDNIAPYIASSGAFWTALVHSNLDYMLKRWPVDPDDDKKALTTLNDRYMMELDSSRRERARNGLSRLWWAVYLTVQDDAPPEKKYELTAEMMGLQDIMSNILDRETFDRTLAKSFIRILKDQRDAGNPLKRDEYRALFRYLYTLQSSVVLNAFSQEELSDMLMEYLGWYRAQEVHFTKES